MFTLSSKAQEYIFPTTYKYLDSIVEYEYTSINDSIRRSKTEYSNYIGGIHKSVEYFRWYKVGQRWVHDYSLLHNRIDLFLDQAGNILRETKHLWNSLDSTYMVLSETNWNIDSEGRLVYEDQEILNMEGNTIRGYYKNFEYNTEGYLVFENKCEWTINIIDWWGKCQHEYAYDSGGNIITHIEHGWNPDTRVWQPDLKEEWDYQSSRTQISYIKYLWDSNINDWVNKSKWTRTNNTNLHWVQEICQTWLPVDSIWEFDRKKERIYDESGVWTSEKTYDWSEGKNDWENAAWQERGLDNNDLLVLNIIYIWDSSKNDWAGYDKKEMDYDASGNQTLIIKYEWNSENSNWVKHSKTSRYFDQSQNKAKEEIFQWDAAAASWTGIRKSEWEFDGDNDLVVHSDFESIEDSPDWDIITKDFYYYQSTSSSPVIITDDNIRIYPNPSSGIMTIDGMSQSSEIMIYSVHGKILKTFIQDNNNIDISELPAGIYFLMIKSGTKTEIHKIVLDM